MNFDVCIKCRSIVEVVVRVSSVDSTCRLFVINRENRSREIAWNSKHCCFEWQSRLTSEVVDSILKRPHTKLEYDDCHIYFFAPEVLWELNDYLSPTKNCGYYTEQLMESYYES